ncbi:MAG: type II secretion system protein GspE, partial [Flexistipes sinusarabici]
MKKLGEILVEKELITYEQLNKALKKQSETGDRLGKLLIKMDIVSEEQLFTFLSKQYGVVMFNGQELTIPADVQKFVKYDLVYNYGIIPFKVTDK